MFRILLLAALPQEYGRLLRKTGGWKKVKRDGFTTFTRCAGESEALLVETGMGAGRIDEATELAASLWSAPPDLIISMGFAGSLCESFGVGEVLLGDRLTFRRGDAARNGENECAFHFRPSRLLSDFCARRKVKRARVVTLSGCFPKSSIAALFRDAPSIVDMESFAVARIAHRDGIAFLCLRSISDALSDEIDFDPAALSDDRGQVAPARVAAQVIRNPRLLRSFFLAWRRATVAAERLAQVLASLLALPAQSLRETAAGSMPDATFPDHSGMQ